jgi:hypothetical protein
VSGAGVGCCNDNAGPWGEYWRCGLRAGHAGPHAHVHVGGYALAPRGDAAAIPLPLLRAAHAAVSADTPQEHGQLTDGGDRWCFVRRGGAPGVVAFTRNGATACELDAAALAAEVARREAAQPSAADLLAQVPDACRAVVRAWLQPPVRPLRGWPAGAPAIAAVNAHWTAAESFRVQGAPLEGAVTRAALEAWAAEDRPAEEPRGAQGRGCAVPALRAALVAPLEHWVATGEMDSATHVRVEQLAKRDGWTLYLHRDVDGAPRRADLVSADASTTVRFDGKGPPLWSVPPFYEARVRNAAPAPPPGALRLSDVPSGMRALAARFLATLSVEARGQLALATGLLRWEWEQGLGARGLYVRLVAPDGRAVCATAAELAALDGHATKELPMELQDLPPAILAGIRAHLFGEPLPAGPPPVGWRVEPLFALNGKCWVRIHRPDAPAWDVSEHWARTQLAPAHPAPPPHVVPATSAEIRTDPAPALPDVGHVSTGDGAPALAALEDARFSEALAQALAPIHRAFADLARSMADLADALRVAILRIDRLDPLALPESPAPKETTPMTTPPKFPDVKPSLVKTLQADATDAAWRTAGSQFVKLSREPLVGLLARHLGPDDDAFRARVAAFLETEIGTALLASMLSAGLAAMPAVAGDVPQRLARELRVRAMADAGDVVAEVLMGPLRQVMALYLRDMPTEIAVQPAGIEDGGQRVVTAAGAVVGEAVPR